jgi:hypothetical protein
MLKANHNGAYKIYNNKINKLKIIATQQAGIGLAMQSFLCFA